MCLPTNKIELGVDVILSPNNGDDSVCAIITVEEHISCTCDCTTTQEDCNRQTQSFVPRECKCVCFDTAAKMACHEHDYYWDEISCSCLCLPRKQWKTCHTGYVFIPSIETCACVSIYQFALFDLVTLIVALVSSMGVISTSLLQCYKSKTGLFKVDSKVSKSISKKVSLKTTLIIINASQNGENV